MKQLQLSIFLVCIFQILSNSITGTNHLPNMVGSGGRSGGRPTGCASCMPDHHHPCSREEKETKEGIVLSNILSCDSHMIRLYACTHQVLPITDDETGDLVSQNKAAISDEVATNVSGSSGSDLNITRAKSLEVLVPKGNLIDRVILFW